MKDEQPEVRLGAAKSLYDIFMSSDQSLLSSSSTIIATFQKDTQYKVREIVVSTLARLGAHYGLEAFKGTLDNLYFLYLVDPVFLVREKGVTCLDLLTEKFGASWIVESLIPKFQNYLTMSKSSYLIRITLLGSLASCAKHLNQKQVTDNLLVHLIKYLKDKVPNVRFFVLKSFMNIHNFADPNGKEKMKT